MKDGIYLTVTHLDDFGGHIMFRVGDKLDLKKDEDNPYDDEAIAVYKDGYKCGYVANSAYTVARGTYSAGRLFDLINDDGMCTVCFITQDIIIGELMIKERKGKN